MLATPIVPLVPQNGQKTADCGNDSSINVALPFDLSTHNGRITFTNGKVYTFRARTVDDERVIEDKRGKTTWKPLGTIASDGTVVPSIKPSLQKGADKEFPYAVKAVAKINAKVKLLNNPEWAQERGCTISFSGTCRCCNRPLTDPKSITEGIGPVCRKKLAAMTTSQIVLVSSPDFDAQDVELPHTGPATGQVKLDVVGKTPRIANTPNDAENTDNASVVASSAILTQVPDITCGDGLCCCMECMYPDPADQVLHAIAAALSGAAGASPDKAAADEIFDAAMSIGATPAPFVLDNIIWAQQELEARGLAWGFVAETLDEIAGRNFFIQSTRNYIDQKCGRHQLVQIGEQTYRYQADSNGWQLVCRVENGVNWGASPDPEEARMVTAHVRGLPVFRSLDVNRQPFTYQLNPDGSEFVALSDGTVALPYEAYQAVAVLAGDPCPPDQLVHSDGYTLCAEDFCDGAREDARAIADGFSDRHRRSAPADQPLPVGWARADGLHLSRQARALLPKPSLRRVPGGWEADSKSKPGVVHKVTFAADWRGHVTYDCTCPGHRAHLRNPERSDCWHIKKATRLGAFDKRVKAKIERQKRDHALPISRRLAGGE